MTKIIGVHLLKMEAEGKEKKEKNGVTSGALWLEGGALTYTATSLCSFNNCHGNQDEIVM